LLTAVDRHRTRTANRGAAGIAKCQAPVALLLDAYERVEYRHPSANVAPNPLRMCGGTGFWIESLNPESNTHRRRETLYVKRNTRGDILPVTPPAVRLAQSNSNALGEFVRLRHPSFVTSTMSSMRTAPRPG